MLDRIKTKKTEEFLKEKFNAAVYLNEHPEAKAYRIEHSYRVANIGLEIARGEGFDETEMVVACLLHDVSYCEEFGENGWIEHGRLSARIARPFLENLGFNEDRVNDVCFGIAIHVDDKADFVWERTPFALSVGDADNIDRFDAYRIHETLVNDGFLSMDLDRKLQYVRKRLGRLGELIDMPMGTRTAERLWRDRISFNVSFYKSLLAQLERSERPADEVDKDRGQAMTDYETLIIKAKGLTEGVGNLVSDLANISALLNETLDDINWVGFYLAEGEKLVLGPFQGRPACIEIPFGRGVCGTAAATGKTLRVDNVHEFVGHIACDGASKSEIVVPVKKKGRVIAVLDIDSPSYKRFDANDEAGLEKFVGAIEESIADLI